MGDSTKSIRKRGRRTRYAVELAKQICERLAEGETLRRICRSEGMPPRRTVRRWADDEKHPFSAQYARAREEGYHLMAEEILDIVDDALNDWVEREGPDGKMRKVFDHEHVQRSRLRAEARKWLLSKALPKVYGDRIEHKHAGKDGEQIVVNIVA